MKIISVASQKGGVGKDTVTCLLSTCLASEGHNVVVIDSDSQKTLSNVYDLEKDDSLIDVISVNLEDVANMIQEIADSEEIDFIFLILPRFTNEDKNSMLSLFYCDFVFVPIVGGIIELFSVESFAASLLVVEKSVEHDFKYYGFMNRYTRRNEDAATKDAATKHLPMMQNVLKDLSLFRNITTTQSILSSKEGKRRFETFYDEFKGLIK